MPSMSALAPPCVPKPDRVHAHAVVGRELGRVERVGAHRAPSVGEQDDRAVLVRARRHHLRLRLGLGLRLVERLAAPAALAHRRHRARSVSTSMPSSGNSVASARMMPLPIAVLRWSSKRSIAAMRSSRSLRRRLHEQRRARERDDADAHVGRLVLDELLRRRLRGDDAARLDVARAHAERHVDRRG